MKQFYLLISLIAFSTKLFALDIEPNLCKENEHVTFSCATGEKVISVCSSKLSYHGNWYLVYRFGKVDSDPELEYLSTAKDFEKKFNYAYDGYSKGSTQELKFSIGEYTYILHEDRHRYRDDSAGLFVRKNNKTIKYFPCNNSNVYDKRTFSLYDLKKEGFSVEYPSFIGTKAP
ncbi:MAG: hypothetical protein WA916_12210 [Arcobacter sp.]|uniref:hypothetical protein n=1 Tax=Arcobacter sp. TaxID=1872629 RepID=UPI003C789D4C